MLRAENTIHAIAWKKTRLECDQYLILPTLAPGRARTNMIIPFILLRNNICEWGNSIFFALACHRFPEGVI
jgi:hypothetical protein